MSRQPTLHSFNWRAVPHIRAGGSRHKLHRTHTETVCEQCELPLVYHPELSPSRLTVSPLSSLETHELTLLTNKRGPSA